MLTHPCAVGRKEEEEEKEKTAEPEASVCRGKPNLPRGPREIWITLAGHAPLVLTDRAHCGPCSFEYNVDEGVLSQTVMIGTNYSSDSLGGLVSVGPVLKDQNMMRCYCMLSSIPSRPWHSISLNVFQIKSRSKVAAIVGICICVT